MNTNSLALPIHDDDLVYAPAILILSQDLYPRKLEVVREYIQNASDALDSFGEISHIIDDGTEPLIKISIQGRSLLVYDTGIGMDADDVAKLRRIAYSEKRVGKEAGYKGIGRLAGIAVADKLKISSTSYGDPKLHHFEFRAKEMRDEVDENKRKGIIESATEVIKRHTTLWSDEIDPKDHYTIVEIREIAESCSELLDPTALQEYIGDIAPVDFSPQFKWGAMLSEKLRQNVPDYSPKTIYLANRNGERARIYKPYIDQMLISQPGEIPITDPADPSRVIAFCWYATKGQKILGEIRPSGKIFAVDGKDFAVKKRFAGLVYKLFGFSVGDRSLPARTLWDKSEVRAKWFTGEIHIIDKGVLPTTDRSDFVENRARDVLYEAGKRVSSTLNKRAQQISDNRKAFSDTERLRQRFESTQQSLKDDKFDRSSLKRLKEEAAKNLEILRARQSKCTDDAIKDYLEKVSKFGKGISTELDSRKPNGKHPIPDISTTLGMTSKAKKVYDIIMQTLSVHFKNDADEYYSVSNEIVESLRRRY